VKLPVILRDAAEAELTKGIDYYESCRSGLGTRFFSEVRKVFRRIAANPRIHSLVLADVRKAVVSGFPYVIFYRETQTRIDVVAVFHTRRDPAIWQGRI